MTLAIVERAGPALERLQAAGLEAEATMLQASRLRPLAGGHRLAAENPVRSSCRGVPAMSGLVVGAGCSRGCPAQELLELIGAVLDEAGAQPGAVRALATVDRRADEPGMVAAARHHGWPLVTHPAPALRDGGGADALGRGRRARRHAERRGGGGAAERRAALCSCPSAARRARPAPWRRRS